MNPSLLSDPRTEAREFVRRYLFGIFALVYAFGSLQSGTNSATPVPARIALALGFLLTALLCVAAWRRQSLRGDATIVAVSSAGLILVTAGAVANGSGLNTPAMGFLAVFTFLIGATVNARLGALVALASATVLIGLGWAEYSTWIRGVAALADMPMPRRVLSQLILIGVALAGGLLVTKVFEHYLDAGRERELRFQGLLGIAADSYWEMDESFVVTAVWRRADDRRFVAAAQPPQRPWDQPHLVFDEGALAAHQADLAARRPFRDLHVCRRRPDGSLRHELVSGEPRVDAEGRFLGYWGVSRDVTADMETRQALALTENRYRELFALSPLALVIHRGWRVLDANPAALALFGYPDLTAMRGQDVLAPLDDAQRVLARQRHDALCAGDRLLPATYASVMRDGRDLTITAVSVCLDHDEVPTLLTIYDDVTERVAADEALRRSQAMLSLLVTTSPDLITLTRLDSGRYAMVNEAFTRFSGYTSAEAVGRSSLELGVWGSDAAREDFVRRIRETGAVRDLPIEFVGKSGQRFALLVSGTRFEMDGVSYLVLNGRDVTVAERTRLAHEAVLDNASLGIGFTRGQVFVQANPALEQMLGWAPGTLPGQPGRVVWADDAEYAEVGALIGPALARGEPVEFVREMQRRDGNTFWCRMLAKAVDPTHPMRGGTIWIVEDITERRRVEQALAKARDDAEAANRAKSAFLANTSHEIRTPLNGLLGLARLLRRPDLDETRRHQYLDQIGDSAETLSAVISDVLDLSKIEAGKLLVETVAFDLRASLGTLARGYAALADARGLGFDLQLDAALPQRVQGDPVRLRQVLGNYLNNALKFTPRGHIALQVRALRDGWVRFEVRDTGPGIGAATLAQLFQPFTQGDQSTTRRFGGTGLGLSICRELATLMGGQVGVESHPGEGSVFWAELPLPLTETPQDESGFSALDAPQLAGAYVLMVEDNGVNMTIAVAMLEQWGVQVAQATDGAMAIAAVEQAALAGRPFDALLMDVQMPVMSGHEATRRLRERHPADSLPIIALTAAALTSEREQALASGMTDFLTKPIDAQRLHDTLAAAIARRSGS